MKEAKVYKRAQDAKTIKRLKKKFLIYYRKLPIQRFARQWIARDEDTISNWKHDDPQFADDIATAESDWTLENASLVKHREFLLERIQHQEFMERRQEDHGVTDELSQALDRLASVLPTVKK